MDAIGIPRAILAGHNWGGRAACVAAALWPDRCAGLVTVNSYLIQDLRLAMLPVNPEFEAALWYEYYFQLECGRAGLAANRRSRGCYGNNGRRTGILTTPPSIARPPRMTITSTS